MLNGCRATRRLVNIDTCFWIVSSMQADASKAIAWNMQSFVISSPFREVFLVSLISVIISKLHRLTVRFLSE